MKLGFKKDPQQKEYEDILFKYFKSVPFSRLWECKICSCAVPDLSEWLHLAAMHKEILEKIKPDLLRLCPNLREEDLI